MGVLISSLKGTENGKVRMFIRKIEKFVCLYGILESSYIYTECWKVRINVRNVGKFV